MMVANLWQVCEKGLVDMGRPEGTPGTVCTDIWFQLDIPMQHIKRFTENLTLIYFLK